MMSAMSKASTTLSPLAALVVGSLGVVAITVALFPFNDGLNRAAPALLLLIPVIATGALGGRLPAAAVAHRGGLRLLRSGSCRRSARRRSSSATTSSRSRSSS